MDRHIYRAKVICSDKWVSNKWVYGYYVCVPNERNHNTLHLIISQDCFCYSYNEFLRTNIYEVEPNTVCQCIGWKDSNNTPIFENDIVGFGSPGS